MPYMKNSTWDKRNVIKKHKIQLRPKEMFPATTERLCLTQTNCPKQNVKRDRNKKIILSYF